MEYKDYYRILGVERGASREDVKRAYRKLASKYHPDVSEEPDAEARFKEISEAYEVLHDPDKRAAYDQFGSSYRHGQEFRPPPGWDFGGRGFQGGGASGFSSFFEELFGMGGGFGGGPGQPRARRGQDQTSRLSVSLEEAFHGVSRRLRLARPEGGEREVDVKVPAGVQAGQRIRLQGQGGPGMGGGPAGDLLLEIEVRPHPRFLLEGRDVIYRQDVMPWQAGLGDTLKVPTLGGAVELKLPAGTRSGSRMRLKGRGLPGSPAGDQLVEIRVQAPAAEDGSQREAYLRMKEAFQAESSEAGDD